ncbi:MAG: aromatic amino acid transporter AroP, partial [Bifidobacteriales bacterium]|nr:aromatic amino acid transporter AroP [Bifidobacteriales bacterium]
MAHPPAPSPASASQSRFKGIHVAMISIGGIIGAGLFVGTSATIAAAGPAVLLSYLAAGLVVWLVMRLLGGLAITARGQGSFITHIATHIGSRTAFITGWSYAFL